MPYIDYNTLNFIKESWPNRVGKDHLWHVPQTCRWIQINTPISDNRIHYEVTHKSVELHIEHDDWSIQDSALIDYLSDATAYGSYIWEPFYWGYRCVLQGESLDKDYYGAIREFVDKFDNLINGFLSKKPTNNITHIKELLPSLEFNGTINLEHLTLGQLLSLPLNIPDYQRIYCWEEGNVKCLLDDLEEHLETGANHPYRLGCIILHENCGRYDIIDGQQRLVTLAILCEKLGYDSKLLDASFESEESVAFIAYNKHLIQKFSEGLRQDLNKLGRRIINEVDFAVLILKNASLDLAYRFFSHQNSRGVPLTDYDLLKAHHLRYIPSTFERMATQAALGWNEMIQRGHKIKTDPENPKDRTTDHERVLDVFLYNLRRWMRHEPGGDNGTPHRVKKEYESAPIIEDIPPFGERFYFNEPIQGGTHFFEWVKRNLSSFNVFKALPEIKILQKYMTSGSSSIYREMIMALAFGYYLKFGTDYLAEALNAITRVVVQHRYESYRVQKNSILESTYRRNIIQMIDQATSPTFMLAECKGLARSLSYPHWQDLSNIQRYVRKKMMELGAELSKYMIIDSFKRLNS